MKHWSHFFAWWTGCLVGIVLAYPHHLWLLLIGAAGTEAASLLLLFRKPSDEPNGSSSSTRGTR